ncbi:restriction endonuclease subunit S [Rhizobium sp. RHZ01]|nr:restriction endonuclease subunit S [Rhizobium sp. RHZ01]
MREVVLGEVAQEEKRRHGSVAYEGAVFGVDKASGLTAEPRYQSKDLSRYKLVGTGMFAYNPMRLNIGSIGFLFQGRPEGIVSPDYVVFSCTQGLLVPDYFYYHTKSDVWRNWIESAGEGSVRERIYFSKLATYRFMLPSLSYQEQAVCILSALDDKIELNRQMNETLEAMAQAIFRDWFVDFGPTRRRQQGVTDFIEIMGGLVTDAERAQRLADLFPAKFGENGLPEGWREGDLSQFAGLNIESWGARTAPSEIKYVDLSNTKWGAIESTTLFTWTEAPSRARRVLREGDTIVGTVRPGNGSYAYIGSDGLTGSTGFAVLRPTRREHSEIVYCAATSRDNIERLEKLADGGAYPAVRPDVILATPMPAIPPKMADGFSSITAPMIAKIEHNKRESHTLVATRDLLLPKLMSGEIRLQEADEVLDAAQ